MLRALRTSGTRLARCAALAVAAAASSAPAHATSTTFLDERGLPVEVTLRGPGAFEVVHDPQSASVVASFVLTGTTAASRLTIDLRLGEIGRASWDVRSLTCATPLGELHAPHCLVSGDGLDLAGGVRAVTVGDVRGVVRVGADPRRRLAPVRMRALSVGPGARIECPDRSLDLVTRGRVAGATVVAGAVRQILGDRIDANVRAATSIGLIRSVGDCTGTFAAREIGRFRVGQDPRPGAEGARLTGAVLAAVRIGVVRIGGAMTGSKVLGGTTLGEDGALGGDGSAGDAIGAGRVGAIVVAGAIRSSVLGAGYDPVNGVYADGDDAVVGGSASRIGRISAAYLDDTPGVFIGAGRIGPVLVAGELVRPDDAPTWVTRPRP